MDAAAAPQAPDPTSGPGADAVVRGRVLAVDVGRARVGLASSDPDGLMATPVATLRRDARRLRDLDELAAHAEELDVVAVVVGLPRNLRGEHTPSTEDALAYAAAVRERLAREGRHVPVRLVDERLSTVTAQAGLHRAGRRVKDSRDVIDQAAAVAILQSALDEQRRTGMWAGTPAEEETDR
ncbi:Holliday junction resolvase RuvX [Micrococcus sp.]|uniref:Holliday junction resolvase RuvX n=1 Tax=Micrococcus sp. TaxID=1271 RepID=UPI0026DD7CE8|nr:Holliday junction resolvase RuvX [Micrococcus sp.]MDO4240020.1 Holliday junction resolvase RuvX [Micrococcus sp.]